MRECAQAAQWVAAQIAAGTAPQEVLVLARTHDSLAQMQLNNPDASGQPRADQRLCAGQTLLCKALGLKVPMWDAKRFDQELLYVEDVGQVPTQIIQTTRLGIPTGRDEHLMYRFVDAGYAPYCTRNPLRRGQVEGRDYFLI